MFCTKSINSQLDNQAKGILRDRASVPVSVQIHAPARVTDSAVNEIVDFQVGIYSHGNRTFGCASKVVVANPTVLYGLSNSRHISLLALVLRGKLLRVAQDKQPR
jgi:hypothetical protein